MATPEEIAAERERRARARRQAPAAQSEPVQAATAPPTREEIAAERWRRRGLRQDQARRDARRQPQPRQMGWLEDVGRSTWTGIQEGVAGLSGMGGDLRDTVRTINRAAADRLGLDADAVDAATMAGTTVATMGLANPLAPSTQQNIDTIESATGPMHQPQTTAGQYARTGGQFASGAFVPGSTATRIARVAVPAVASETAGQLTAGTPYEPYARLGGALVGGVVTESAVAGNAARNRVARPTNDAQALADEFGPLTRGERSANAQVRREETNLRLGRGPERAQSVIRGFDADRAPQIRDNAMRIVSRGQEPISQDVGEAGTILADELRSARDALRARKNQLYGEAEPLLAAERIVPSNDTLLNALEAAAERRFSRIPADTREALTQFENEVARGEANHARLEEVRKALNRDLTTARRQGNARDEFIVDELIDALDAWQLPRLTNQAARRAITEARGINGELRSLYSPQSRTELSSGHTGTRDLGGGAVERVATTDLTGEQVIDSMVGAGRRPSQQALSAVRRIKELGTERIIYTNRNATSGTRVPGRTRVGGRTAGARRFAADDPNAPPTRENPRGGTELPTNELQALREGLWHRMLGPLDEYISRVQASGVQEGGILPAQKMVSALDNALNRSGREIMRVLYTERELAAMQRFLQFMQRIVPPPGAAWSGTAQALAQMISRAVDSLVGIVPGVGQAWKGLRYVADEYDVVAKAERSVRQPRPRQVRPQQPERLPEQPQAAGPVVAAGIGASYLDDEPRRRIGERYP